MAEKKPRPEINIKNKKAFFDYHMIEDFTAGIQLVGSEIKSIREGNITLKGSHCFVDNGELFVKGMDIQTYKHSGVVASHDPKRNKKLLLKKKEIRKIEEELKVKGITVVVTGLFLTKRGFAKLNIALAKGKKSYDKRESMKKRDIEREMKRKDI